LKQPTKLVRVNLAAMTRVEWSGVVRVPADVGKGEYEELARQMYDTVDGDEWQADTEFWDRGTCYGEDIDELEEHEAIAYIQTEDGDLVAAEQKGVKHG